MIKLSAMVRERPDGSLESLIERAYRLGLDTVDIHVGGMPRDPDYLRRIKLLCLKLGLPIGYLGSGGGFVGTPEDIRRQVDQAKADVDTAAFLGAPLVRLMGGRVLDTTENAEEARSGIVRSFQEVADYAAPKGVVLGVQNHPPPAAPTGEDIIRIIEEADRENVSHIMDTGQWWGSIGADPRGQFDPDVDIYDVYAANRPIRHLCSGQDLQDRLRARGVDRLRQSNENSTRRRLQWQHVHLFRRAGQQVRRGRVYAIGGPPPQGGHRRRIEAPRTKSG